MERYEDIKPLSREEKEAAEALDIDFSDVTMKEKSREQIIEEAEAMAFDE